MINFRNLLIRATAAGVLTILGGWALGQDSSDVLERGFKQPPESAKPRVWWHWLNGNITKEGITADLEWMKRVGIGGMQMFDGSLAVPQFTEKRLVWMTPEWKDAFRHAAAEADRLGLEMSMAASGGWSETAGPWVRPEEGMKKVVWSETRLEGPRNFKGALPNPPSSNGRFQDVAPPPEFDIPEPTNLPGAKPAHKAPKPPPDPTHYADVAVIAYRLPDDEVRMADLRPKVTSSAAGFVADVLLDGSVRKTVSLPLAEGAKEAWIQYEFAQPFRAQAFSIATASGGFLSATIPSGRVQASQDGTNWIVLVNLPGPSTLLGSFPVRTYSFPEVSARFYRVILDEPVPNPILATFGMGPARSFGLAEMEFLSGPRVNHWEDKASFGTLLDAGPVGTPPVAPAHAIARDKVVDLTAKMPKDGTLDWDVPAGKWVVLRMGYSLTGEKNHPATPEATGYEVDKLNRKHVDSYVQNYAGQVADALGPYFGKSFKYFLMDSWEAGQENWTDDMIAQFRQRRGYDPTPYLPVLTGRVVESADVSERFLWDFRRTIADLLAENHYAAATEYFHKRGVGLYAEAMGAALPTTGDGLLNKGAVDIPMGEFWVPLPGQEDTPEHPADVRETASAAHIYGKPFAAAESFTSMPFIPGWGQSPAYLKPIADKHLAMGINRIVFHTSDLQPFVDEKHKPGITLWMFGQHYTRNITWAEQAVAWNTYLSRCSHLLQQGQYVGDIAYFYGEGAPITAPFWKQLKPAPPAGFSYDYLNADVLLNRSSVQDGRLVLKGGMTYRVLVIPEDIDQLTLPVVRKLKELVAAGAVLIAPKPIKSPSLSGYPASDAEIRAIANEVWGVIDGKSITEHAYGKGKVYSGREVRDILTALKVDPDLEYTRPNFDTDLAWIHRKTNDADIYFIANQIGRVEDLQVRLRIAGKAAELWRPDTGSIEPAGYAIESGRTTVPLHLGPYDSVFVVLRQPSPVPRRNLPRPVSIELATLQGPWDITFPANWGAPPSARMDTLASWHTNSDEGIKYFSGTATYSKSIDAPQDWFRAGHRLMLDLGAVREIAEVSVNGKALGILWKPPYQADVTEALKAGANRLEVKVTNLWPNRIIGDQFLPPEKRYTFTVYEAYKKNSPLLESGILGPVKLSTVSAQ